MKAITELTLQELQGVLGAWGDPAYHAKQVFSWIFQRGVLDFAAMSDLPNGLRERLAKNFSITDILLIESQLSRDGTRKFLFRLNDGYYIEAVAIPAEKRLTACISSQAGCRFACRFCASGKTGLKRNLTTGEIVNQLLHIRNSEQEKQLTHVVFMGTGEPLDNYDAVLRAVRTINAECGFGIGARRITISTCGLVPGIARLAGEGLQIELSVSLHAADDVTRNMLMPVNRKYPLAVLMNALRDYVAKTKRQVTFEYILAEGVNSDLPSAQNLCTILRGLTCKVNLIPVNPFGVKGMVPPGKLAILKFCNRLKKCGIPATVRTPRGQDIEAACGQLRLRYEKN